IPRFVPEIMGAQEGAFPGSVPRKRALQRPPRTEVVRREAGEGDDAKIPATFESLLQASEGAEVHVDSLVRVLVRTHREDDARRGWVVRVAGDELGQRQ